MQKPINRIQTISVCCLILITFILFPITIASAGDEPFTYASNWGGTGLWETPSARVMRENSYRVGAAQADPYRYYYITLSPLEGLEINGRITEILGVQALTNAYGNFKDKAIDLKYQFLSEGKYAPALALGIMDSHGTRIYPSQYLVASKQIYPFDFTIGLGNGKFGKKPLPPGDEGVKLEIFSSPYEWLIDSQLFWGIQFAPTEKFAFALEYNPIQYHKQIRDPAQAAYFSEPVPSQYNFGIRYKPTKWTEMAVSYQRGNQIGINFSMTFDIGKPLLPLYDHVYKETPSDRLETPSERITRTLYRSGFSNIGINIDGDTLWLEAQNDKYFYTPRAIGMIIQILADKAPEYIDDIHIMIKELGIPVVKIMTKRADIQDLYAEKMTLNEFIQLAPFETSIQDIRRIKGKHKKLFSYGFKPTLQSYLNSREGFLKYRVGMAGWGRYHPWSGASLIAGIEWHLLNNVPLENVDDTSIQVRGDVALYQTQTGALSRLMFDQTGKLTPWLFGKISVGLLETMYAGIDAEIAAPILDGRIYLGLSGSAVKKRAPDNLFELKKNAAKNLFSTSFFNTRLNIPEKELAIEVKAGQFMAGDKGMRLTVYKYIKGVTLWAWYTSTDTSIFTDSYNKGYHDKGIGISIPLKLFKGTDSRTSFKYLLSPWTRDTGQDIDHFNTLFDFIGRKSRVFLDKDNKLMYK